MNIALFLSSDGIALAHRQPAGHWAMIGETALDVPDLSASLAELRDLAVTREGSDFETLLVLPDDQILYTSLTAPTADPELTTFRIEDGLDGLTPYTIAELEYDWRVQEEGRVKIAVVARETLDEARAFAAQYGFTGAGFAAMPPMQRFPGVPLFDLGDAAKGMDFSAEGIAFGSDEFGASEETEAEAEEDGDKADAASEKAATDDASDKSDATPEVTEPESEAESDKASDAAPKEAALVDKDVAQDDADGGDGDDTHDVDDVEDEPDTDSPALAEALQMSAVVNKAEPVRSIDDPTQSGPIAPNPDEPEDETDATAQDASTETGEDDTDLPPMPSPASAEAGERARTLRGEAPVRRPDADDSGKFTARRGRVGAPETDRESLVGQRSARIDLASVERPEAAGQMPAPASAPTTPSGAAAGTIPRLSEQLQRVRAASQSRPKSHGRAPDALARMPRVEIQPQPPTTATGLSADLRPSPFGLTPPTPGQEDASEAQNDQPKRGILGGLRRSRRGAPPVTPAAAASSTTAAAPDAATGDTAVAEDTSFSSGLLARKATPSVGPSFRTGLILTVILLVLLAIVAIWSAIFLPDSPLARLFGTLDSDQAGVSEPLTAPGAPEVVASTPLFGTIEGPQPSLEDEAAADGIDLSVQEPVADAVVPLPADDPPEDLAADPAAAEESLPDIDADFDLPPLPPIDPGQNPSIEDAEALYAEDGIWARSPDRPDLRPFDLLDQVYTASIDPAVAAFDAVALPDPGVNPGELLRRMPPPPAFGAVFDLTASGMVAPTPEGVLTPEGAFVIAGAPPFAAIPRPREVAEPVATIDVDSAVLAAFRPAERPEDLSETRERQILGGLTNDELSAVRPPERPMSPQEAAARASLFPGDENGGDPVELESGAEVAGVAEAVAEAIGGSELATASSRFPAQRPANIAQIVASAERAPEVPDTVIVAAADVAPGPNIPSNADVSRAATERNAIRLRNVNLIGVTGTPSDRRALVRLSSGRFVRVGVGDRLDGGRVAAIGETTLQYVRSGRTVTLEIPG